MHPNPGGLASLSVGSLTLTPAFDPSVTEYTASTTNATNKVTATLQDSVDSLEIKVGDTVIQNKGNATWTEGANTLTVKVTDSETSVATTYTVTVTYSTEG